MHTHTRRISADISIRSHPSPSPIHTSSLFSSTTTTTPPPRNYQPAMSCGEAKINCPAPAFEEVALMPNGTFKKISLSNYKGKWVVLFFYPLDFTFVCPTEIIQFSDNVSRFNELNCEVISCSMDSEYSHLQWTMQDRKKGGLGPMAIPMLADKTKSIARAYGVLEEKQGVSYRGLFIIDPHGMVRQITINDMPVGRNVDEVLRLLEAFQFVEKHGEVCPANWKKGGPTMKPEPKAAVEGYFSKL
ncbi:tryparedoxin peroxidase [Leishmania tarentolae]|uniref:thioredoxin-dependent peroxiredoxin n=1 Tax=Leishmania tarentolae TaxID=5689 RepID=A0A640KDZ8_LEITA|nr:tryparedoxin peroxidase [Leishmania tarentolae]